MEDSTRNQKFPGGITVSIMRSKKDPKQRFARITRRARGVRGLFRYTVAVELLSLSAGKDVWMRDVLVRCADCRVPTKAGEMENGQHCAACYEKAGNELSQYGEGPDNS